MKKILFIMSLCVSLFLFGCNKQSGQQDEGFFYDNDLIVEGVFEDMENHVMSGEGILLLNGYFEYHADHIYFPQGMREEYFKSENDYLPGNTIKFMGNVKEFDAGAGNHYYEVVSIYKMKTKGYPSKQEITDIIDSYNFCEKKSDCVDFDPGCDFDCSMSVNVVYKDIASKIVGNYIKQKNKYCERDCASTIQMACENNKCIALKEKPIINCTEEDKLEKECTNKFEPVCGNDDIGYNNPCLACQSKYIDSYTEGGCNMTSYFIEGTPESLEYVEGFLEDGSVSCDMSYSFEGEKLEGKIIADKDRFFAIRDIYYDGKIYHDYGVLSIQGGRYEWLEELPEINRAYNLKYEIKNEIEGVLVAAEVFDDFSIKCYEGIDDESVFIVPDYIEFKSEN